MSRPTPIERAEQRQIIDLRGEIARADDRGAGTGQLRQIGRAADLLHRFVGFEDRPQSDRVGDHVAVGQLQDRFVDPAVHRLEEMVRLAA